jgi:hypothetical protein
VQPFSTSPRDSLVVIARSATAGAPIVDGSIRRKKILSSVHGVFLFPLKERQCPRRTMTQLPLLETWESATYESMLFVPSRMIPTTGKRNHQGWAISTSTPTAPSRQQQAPTQMTAFYIHVQLNDLLCPKTLKSLIKLSSLNCLQRTSWSGPRRSTREHGSSKKCTYRREFCISLRTVSISSVLMPLFLRPMCISFTRQRIRQHCIGDSFPLAKNLRGHKHMVLGKQSYPITQAGA